MADESEQGGRDPAEPDGQTDWFGRELGGDWVEVEPGIYERREVPPEPAEPAPEPERGLLPPEPPPRRRRSGR